MGLVNLVESLSNALAGPEAAILNRRMKTFVQRDDLHLQNARAAQERLDTHLNGYKKRPIKEGVPFYVDLHKTSLLVLDLYEATGELLQGAEYPLSERQRGELQEQHDECEKMVHNLYERARASYGRAAGRSKACEYVNRYEFNKLDLSAKGGKRVPLELSEDQKRLKATLEKQKEQHNHEKACFDLVIHNIVYRKAGIDWRLYQNDETPISHDEYLDQVDQIYKNAVRVDSSALAHVRELAKFESYRSD